MSTDHLLHNGGVVLTLQQAFVNGDHSLHVIPGLLKKVIDEGCWQERLVRATGEIVRFERFEDFIRSAPPDGMHTTTEAVKRICRDDPTALDALDRVLAHRQGERTDIVSNRNEVPSSATEERPVGTTAQYAIRRLRKDRPDLHAKVLAGELKPHAAMVEAGFRPRTVTIRVDDVSAVVAALKRHMTPEAFAALRQAIEDKA